MKFILIVSLMVSNAFAAELILQGGEVVTIQPNLSTTVRCGGGAIDSCDEALRILREKFDSCYKNYRGGYEVTSVCVPQVFPSFKSNKPACIFEGEAICESLCIENYKGGYEKTSACHNACK